MTTRHEARVFGPGVSKRLTAHECRNEYEVALTELESLTHVTDPPNAFMNAMIRYESRHRFPILPGGLDTRRPSLP